MRDTTIVSAVPLPVIDTVPKDTIKAPLAHAEMPVLADPSGSFHWDREQLAYSGAMTVQELLDQVPGLVGLRTGWFSTPSTAAYLGDAARLRVFLDGLEMVSLDPHAGGALDLSQIPLWAMDEVTIERSASEVRVYLRSWSVDRTTPFTRADILTGDEQTNLYRGLFARRFHDGAALQFGVQQYGTTPEPNAASNTQLQLMGRLGWARGRFSVDGYIQQTEDHYGSLLQPETGDSLSPLQSTRRDAYLRVGYGDPDQGPWLQAMAASTEYTFAAGQSTLLVPVVPTDTTAPPPSDTTVSLAQYVLTGGFTKWGIRLSGAQRYVVGEGRKLMVPSARASYDWHRLSFSVYAESKGVDSVSHREANVVFTPFSFLRFSAAVGSERDSRNVDSTLNPVYSRLEGALRLHDLWLGGGMMKRGLVSLSAPTLVGDSLTSRTEAAATGVFGSARGKLWKDFFLSAYAIRWSDSTGLYRPQYQTRSELYFDTTLPDRFPKHSFRFTAGITHEYHSTTYFPVADSVEQITGYRALSAQVHIRIMTALLFFKMNNLLGEKYGQIPGFLLPRQTSTYGVQWEFWN